MYRHQILCLGEIIKRTRNIIYTNTNRTNRHGKYLSEHGSYGLNELTGKQNFIQDGLEKSSLQNQNNLYANYQMVNSLSSYFE